MQDLLALLLHGAPAPTSPRVMASDDRVPPDFKPTYDREILPHLVAFEEKRIAALQSLRTRMFIGSPAMLLVVVVCFYILANSSGKVDGLFEITFIVLAAISAWMFHRVTLYHGEVKQQVFPKVFQHFGNFTYTPKADFFIEAWHPTGIIPKITSSLFEDKVAGHYRDVPLSIVEAMLKTGHGKNRSTIFKGLIATIDLPKRFTGTTVIHRDKGKLGNWIGRRKFDPVRLENPDFESRYEVCSTDQIEARYLISTTFMERLIALEEKLDGKIEAAFNNGSLLIMLSSERNWFEPSSIHKPATFAEDIGLIFDQMHQLFAIIDVLKLDDRTGL